VFHHKHLTLHTDGDNKRIGDAADTPLNPQPAAP
jgi:hypothetical protein